MEINSSTILLLKLLRLSSRFHRLKDKRVSQPFEQLSGLSLKTFHTMHLIWNGYCLPGELVHELGVPNSTATRILDTLEADGFISRQPNPQDLRQMQLKLTAKGHQRYQVAWAQYLSCLHQGFGELPESVLESAINAFSKLEHALTKQGEHHDSK